MLVTVVYAGAKSFDPSKLAQIIVLFDYAVKSYLIVYSIDYSLG